MKKICTLLMALLLICGFAFHSFALNGETVIDDADLLTDYEETQLADYIERLSLSYNISIVIHTTPDTNGLYIEDYADNCYDEGGYLPDGLIFVISMAERDYYTSTCGSLVDSMSAYDIDNICEPIVSYLSNAQYFDAFELYLNRLDSYLNGDLSQDDYYGDNYQDADEYSSTEDILGREIILIIIAVIISVIITMVLKSTMNTAVKKRDANDYVIDDSFKADFKRDVFIGSNTTKRALPKNNTNSRSGGSRTSSSGVRHGGSGGKF